MPERIQRRRTKGWRMPSDAVCVGRPSRFGNPFDWTVFGRDASVDLFARWLDDGLSPTERSASGIDLPTPEVAAAHRQRILDGLPLLRGRDLACWCPPGEPCHADVLIERANR
jgi:hypothetical protein